MERFLANFDTLQGDGLAKVITRVALISVVALWFAASFQVPQGDPVQAAATSQN